MLLQKYVALKNKQQVWVKHYEYNILTNKESRLFIELKVLEHIIDMDDNDNIINAKYLVEGVF
jgi:hypothetical protein